MNLFLALGLLLQDPPGPHFAPSRDVRSFERNEKVVGALYYYWFDAESGARLQNGDGTEALRDHPATLKDLSYKRPAWHRAELEEMTKAGIDVVFPVFRSGAEWSLVGLKAMAVALEELERDRKSAPRVGLFCNVSGIDPSRLFTGIRDFFSVIPPRFWAARAGSPIVWLGPLREKPDGGARAIAHLRERFRSMAERDVHIVADASWGDVGADAGAVWGAALNGPQEGDVVSVGPGFDGGPGERVQARDEGIYYERSWSAALRMAARMVVIETWNGFHEATEVCVSREHGRKYLGITARAAEKFRKGEQMSNPRGKWTGADRLLWNLKYEPFERGLRPVQNPDGLFEKVELAGIDVLTTKQNALGTVRYLYFDADDSWAFWEKRSVVVEVEYFDQGNGVFWLQYDSADGALKGAEKAYKRAGEHALSGGGEWRTARFDLPDALFAGRQPGRADFRLAVDRRGLMVRRVSVRGQ